jgi:hypothetical protein
MGVLFSAAVVLAGSLEPGGGSTAAGSQGNSSSYLPIVLKAGGSSSVGVPRTGQTTSYGPRDDGALQKGVAWPSPRLTDNGNGTVTDNLTGLIWLKNANFFGVRNWATALTDCNTLAANGTTLTDGSVAGDWRLPNVKELQSLIDFAYFNPALSNAAGTGQWVDSNPFTSVYTDYSYWSSTTGAINTDLPWNVYLSLGSVSVGNKTTPYPVWPVRGGQ